LKSVHGDPKYAEVRKRLESELARLRRELKVPEEDPPQTARGTARKATKPEAARLHVAKPNVVFFLADDLRPDALGALGHPVVRTPNLDRLVERGQVFRNAYTMGSMHGAVCLPSRTMLLTGRSLFRAKNEPSGATPDALTFPRAMKEAGYATVHAGKFGNSPKAVTGEFDESSDPGQADAVADAVIDFIRRKAGQKPLFVYMAGKEPHDPQYATDEFYARYKPEDIPLPAAFAPFHPFDNGEMTVRDEKTLAWPRTRENVAGKLARYYASISFWDAQVGRVLKALEEAGQLDNTIFVIAGDNGLSLGEHGLLGKQNLYQFGGMHVPLVFAGKGISKGETHALAYLMDIFPTVCELTGIPKPGRVEGLSLAPVIRGEKPRVRDSLFTAYGKCQRAVTDGRWKLIRYPLIDKTQFFDLQADPHEESDLAARPEHAGKVRELTGKLTELQRQWADEHPLTIDNPKPQAWSPEKLTEQDIESQKEETAVSSGKKARKSGPGPRKK
jgi:arylsulfatase A-like enzyme